MAIERNNEGTLCHERRWILLFQPLRNRADIGLCLFNRHAGAKTTDDPEVVRSSGRRIEESARSDPDFRMIGIVEAGRHHADNDKGLAHQFNSATEDGWITAIGATPQSVAEDNGPRSSKFLFSRVEAAT